MAQFDFLKLVERPPLVVRTPGDTPSFEKPFAVDVLARRVRESLES